MKTQRFSPTRRLEVRLSLLSEDQTTIYNKMIADNKITKVWQKCVCAEIAKYGYAGIRSEFMRELDAQLALAEMPGFARKDVQGGNGYVVLAAQ